jgi:hypothetical protein
MGFFFWLKTNLKRIFVWILMMYYYMFAWRMVYYILYIISWLFPIESCDSIWQCFIDVIVIKFKNKNVI